MTDQAELKTSRLLLRQFTPDDVDDVLEYVNDREWAQYQTNIQASPYTREDIETLVDMFSRPEYWETGHPGLTAGSNGAGLLRIFAVVLDGRVIGEIALNRREQDRPNDRVEIACTLSRQYWNRGLTTEAARAVMDWCFQNYDIHRLYAWSDPRNTGSWRVMEKLGMTREGVLREHIKEDGEFRDQAYYGILRREWERDFRDR